MSESQARFDFPRFTLKKVADTEKHQVEVGEVVHGDVTYILEVSRPKDLAERFNISFSVRKVLNTAGVVMWSAEKEGWSGNVFLAEACGKVVLAFVGRGKDGKVEQVRPLTHLHVTPCAPQMKKEAAKFLGRDYLLKTAERLALAQAEAVPSSAETPSSWSEDERSRRRRETLQRILARGKIRVQCPDRTRRGFPVLEGEWQILPDGTDVVRVCGFDDATGTVDVPLEAFRVRKAHGKPAEKSGMIPVNFVAEARPPERLIPNPLEDMPELDSKPPRSSAASAPKPVANGPKPTRSVKVRKDGVELPVHLFGSIEVLREAREHMSPGNYVAVDKLAKDGRLEVFQIISGGGQTTVGMCSIVV